MTPTSCADAAMLADPQAYTDEQRLHAGLTRLRATAPVAWVEVPDYAPFWAITKHADIMEIERANDIFTNYPRPVLMTREADEQQAAVGIRTLI
ncbi:MAG TPA: cytochrome P450, partial [Mycobacterium sp.]|nr:cytochrome P450 [Mycobacterium sp.]